MRRNGWGPSRETLRSYAILAWYESGKARDVMAELDQADEGAKADGDDVEAAALAVLPVV